VKIIELRHWSEAVTPEVQERARNGSACQLTKKYTVLENGNEVAYLALDWWSLDQRTDLGLYELCVLHKFRHCGVGARILIETEKLAGAAGYRRVTLTARSSEDYPNELLSGWYQRHGFKHLTHEGPDEMGKDVEI